MSENEIQLTPEIAEALLEYIAMEDSKTKNIITVLAKTEIQRYLKHADDFAKSQNLTQEEVLLKFIDKEL